jgi:hypothetical protein
MATKFGTEQVAKQTPMWAKWMFRSTLLLTTAIAMYVAGTTLIGQTAKLEIVLLLKCIDPLMLGFSKMFGVEIEKTETDPQ